MGTHKWSVESFLNSHMAFKPPFLISGKHDELLMAHEVNLCQRFVSSDFLSLFSLHVARLRNPSGQQSALPDRAVLPHATYWFAVACFGSSALDADSIMPAFLEFRAQ